MTDLTSAPAPAAVDVPLRRNRPYMLLQTGKTVHIIGAGVGGFAVPLLAFALTGSVVQAGVITAVGEVGALVATLPAGVVADRFDRRKVILVAGLVGAVLWTSLIAAWLTGLASAWHLAAVLLGSQAAATFAGPAESGAIRAVVPPPQLGTALAVVQGRQAAATVVSGPVGGFLYGLSHAFPLIATAIGHLAVVAFTWFVRAPLNPDLTAAKATHPLTQLREGFRFVWSVVLFRVAIGLFVLFNLALTGALMAINLELVRTGTPPLQIGAFDLVCGLALLLGSVIAAPVVARVRLGLLVVGGLGWVALCCIGMAALGNYPGYLAGIGLAALPIPAINAGLGGYVAAITPQELQGRTNSVLQLSGILAMPLAPLLGSGLLQALGIDSALWAFAVGIVVVAVLVGFVRPLRRVGKPESWVRDAIDGTAPAL